MNNDIIISDLELMRKMRLCGHLLYHKYHLNFAQNKILMLLCEKGPMTQGELLCELKIQAGSLSEILSKIESAQFVKKERSASDKRTILVSVTEEGVKQAEAFKEERQRLAAFLFEGVSDSDKESLDRILSQLLTAWSNGEIN